MLEALHLDARSLTTCVAVRLDYLIQIFEFDLLHHFLHLQVELSFSLYLIMQLHLSYGVIHHDHQYNDHYSNKQSINASLIFRRLLAYSELNWH